ncbi:hypothetical protein EVAR_44250_1 [Eumeta japonica]|uniref:Uncharacterized protein n=1 Tax=Eumeta variegata TaxID=151549 RepID=A0A4C1XAD8_EUMVA|nr:hypothetical protein EVAR_44250_1 [Eumeta japonica]
MRLELKAKGPPRPEIALSQKCRKKTKTFIRAFKSEQYIKTPWLCGCEDSNKLFCFPCLVFGACAGAGDGGESVWTDTNVNDLAQLSIKVKEHSQSRFHIAMEHSVYHTSHTTRKSAGIRYSSCIVRTWLGAAIWSTWYNFSHALRDDSQRLSAVIEEYIVIKATLSVQNDCFYEELPSLFSTHI